MKKSVIISNVKKLARQVLPADAKLILFGSQARGDSPLIVDNRTDVAEEYNETFVETGELESLW